MAEDSMIKKWSRWLGVNETPVLKKAMELHRLLELKSSMTNINANNQCIFCVDIAANIMGSNFDSSDAVVRSNLTKNEYLRQKRTVEKLLDVGKIVRIADVCVQLNVNKSVREQAERLFQHYRTKSLNAQTDFSHPQYVAMAIWLCCKRAKVKVSRTELCAVGHLKLAQWKQLEVDWTKWLENNDDALVDGNKIEATAIGMDIDDDLLSSSKKDKVEVAVVTENYELWRERMLQKAYAQLAALKQQELTRPLD